MPMALPARVIPMVGGLPDVGFVPAEALALAYRRVLRTQAERVLDYGDARGHPRLRRALSEMLAATRGVVTGPERLVATRGSQMALYLLARAIVRPGDRIAVEAYGYRPAWEAFRLAGAELLPLAIDEEGLRVGELAEQSKEHPIRAVYLTPLHQYPTTVSLSAARRRELIALARKRRFAIIEDDYDHEFHYVGRPLLPLARADAADVVLYIGTLSKVLAPGLRIGYVHAPESILERIVSYRSYIDHQGDLATEAAIAELIEDGEVQRHIRRARRIYASRRDFFVELLRRRLGQSLSFHVPPGGLALWARTARELPVEAFCDAASKRGVATTGARRFTFDGRSRPYVRLGFARVQESDLERGVQGLVRAAREVRKGRVYAG